MLINFKYSFKEDFRILFRIYRNPKDYTELRSVIWNPFVMLPFFLSREKMLNNIRKNWTNYEADVSKAFDDLELSIKTPITCYITSVGPEGMFDPNRNAIHARYFQSGGWKEFLETIVHESVHLAVYNEKTYKYEHGEKMVDKILETSTMKNILNQRANAVTESTNRI